MPLAKIWRPGLLLAVALATLGYAWAGPDPYLVHIVTWFYLNAVLAATLRLVMLTGELNVAHAGFYGIGAYTAGVLSTKLGVSFVAAVVAGALLAALIAAVFGWVTLRVKGAYFVLISFAFAEMLRLAFGYFWQDWLGGVSGLVGIPLPFPRFGALIVLVMIIFLVILYRVERSDFAKVLKSIESSDELAESIGINVFLYKNLALTLSALMVGAVGGLFAHFNAVITPLDFSFAITINILAFVILGGRKEFYGPIVGAVSLTIFSEYLRGYGAYEPLAYAIALVVCMLLVPGGITGWLNDVWQGLRNRYSPPARREVKLSR